MTPARSDLEATTPAGDAQYDAIVCGGGFASLGAAKAAGTAERRRDAPDRGTGRAGWHHPAARRLLHTFVRWRHHGGSVCGILTLTGRGELGQYQE